ncbi:hypothetical protein TSAR_013077 [Trichomalopsis sarcophagae]|uniref:Reverse transcriptase domain-containing protein n=1 Tax=Trichomalopsis sarcophagae TaxID=543379 RepID=A0A232FMT5_9HYME|nr:hypothetical protein TSAR_013077 [Trichomalopsis sarcophagae]
MKELLATCRRVGNNKASGLDSITNIVLKHTIQTHPPRGLRRFIQFRVSTWPTNLEIPKGATVVGFAENIAVVVVANHKEKVKDIAEESIHIIREWLSEAGLELASHKTKAILISSRKKIEGLPGESCFSAKTLESRQTPCGWDRRTQEAVQSHHPNTGKQAGSEGGAGPP